MNANGSPSLVIIDDEADLLARLVEVLERELTDDGVEIRSWMPNDGDDPLKEFEQRVDANTVLVVTDYDLTKHGMTGLFGASIVNWCQTRSIPVGDFSRRNITDLPREPALFELRIPPGIDEGAAYTARMFRGFRQVRDGLASDAVDLGSVRSPSEALAAVLDRPQQESQFALYMSLLGGANPSLLDTLRSALTQNAEISAPEKQRLLGYVLGHVLVNAVLRYPGPLLSEKALCAYLGTTEIEAGAVGPLFREAIYGGPFSSGATYYWRTGVDQVLDRESTALSGDSFTTSGEFHRAVVEGILNRPLAVHGCPRCGGRNGGFLCPFTGRPVCERADCSVAANSWIPAGADLSRIERDFYDEWAPLLGL